MFIDERLINTKIAGLFNVSDLKRYIVASQTRLYFATSRLLLSKKPVLIYNFQPYTPQFSADLTLSSRHYIALSNSGIYY